MIPWVQEPALRGGLVARPRTGQMPIAEIRVAKEDWADFRAVNLRRAPAVIREFIRWYLRRPGAKLPERPTAEQIDEATKAQRRGEDTDSNA